MTTGQVVGRAKVGTRKNAGKEKAGKGDDIGREEARIGRKC